MHTWRIQKVSRTIHFYHIDTAMQLRKIIHNVEKIKSNLEQILYFDIRCSFYKIKQIRSYLHCINTMSRYLIKTF